MKTSFFTRFLVAPALLLAMLSLNGCGGKDSEPSPADYDGTVTWTRNGKTMTSTIYSGAFYEKNSTLPAVIKIIASQNTSEETVGLLIDDIDTKGVGTYELRKGSLLDYGSAGSVLVGGSGGVMYDSRYAANTVNGTIKVTAYDKAAQKLEGTFSFTGSPAPSSGKTGSQSVTNGTFSFKHFQ